MTDNLNRKKYPVLMSALQIDNRQSDADARYGLADVRAEVLDDHA